jgi:hypothetical protein
MQSGWQLGEFFKRLLSHSHVCVFFIFFALSCIRCAYVCLNVKC